MAVASTALVLAAACQAPPAAKAAAPGGPNVALRAEADLLARIRAELGVAACTRDSQCQTLAIGAKACGGPESWLPWSSVNARAEKLTLWASELASLQRARHERSGIASNCQYHPDPGALCREQRCVLAGGTSLR